VNSAEEFLTRFNATIDDLKAKTAAFQEGLEAAGVTETSPDGLLSVSVAPNGSLTDLRIDDAAWRGTGGDLANKIMKLARKAQRAAAVNVAEAFAPLGADSEAMHMVTGYIPEPEEDEETDGPGYSFDEAPPDGDSQPQRPAHQAEPPQRPARPPRRRPADDDDEYDDGGIFGGDR
jgi:DNA-binding protein YbaB